MDKDTATGSGKIDKSDTQYTVTYTNKTVPQQVYIKKTTQDTQTPLKGAASPYIPKQVMKQTLAKH